MKFSLSNIRKNWLFVVLVVLALVTGAIGFILTDVQGFLGNILAETTGLFIGVVVTLRIVDKYLERQREKRWFRVREITYEAIVAHLRDLVSNMILYLSTDLDLIIPLARAGNQPSDVIAVMTVLKSQLGFFLCNDKPTFSAEFYDSVKWDLDQIRDVLTPRVIQSSNDQQVIDALIEFDQASRKVHNVVVKGKKVSGKDMSPSAIELLKCVQTLYGIVGEKLSGSS